MSPEPAPISASTPSPAGLERRLADDLFRQAPTVVVGTLLLFAVNLVYYVDRLPLSVLIVWTLLIGVATTSRLILLQQFRRTPELCSARIWVHWIVVVSSLLGFGWGFFGACVVQVLPPEHGIAAIATLTGVVGSAATTSSAAPWAFRAMAGTILLPLMAALFVSDHGVYNFMGALALCYLGVLGRAAARVHDTLQRSVRFGLENELLVRTLERQSNIDSLTGLLNRRALNQGFESAWEQGRNTRTSVGLVLCDVDYFKQYNDSLGHLAGDKCLQVVAQALQSVTRSTDLVTARYGGEEFAVLIPESNEQILHQVGERIQRTIRELRIPHPKSKVGDYVTVSTGASQLTPKADRLITELVNQADNALYRAKASGRNRSWLSDDLEPAVLVS